MDFLEVKDAIYLGLAAIAFIRFGGQRRKDAADVAVWRANTDSKIARLDERLTAHKADHESDAAKQEAFRADAYRFMSDTRDRLARIEARSNGA